MPAAAQGHGFYGGGRESLKPILPSGRICSIAGSSKRAETILIHGGASGIGTTAIQIAKAFGAKVFVTVGSEAKSKACRKLGAAAAINYRTQDFVEVTLRLTKGKGVDVVLDMIGGVYLPRNLKVLKPGGRHVSIAMQNSRIAELDIFQGHVKAPDPDRLDLAPAQLEG